MLEHLAIVAVMAAVLSTGCTDVVKETQFKITAKRDNDKMEVKVGKEKTIFSVHSPFGISQADIERSNIWPDTAENYGGELRGHTPEIAGTHTGAEIAGTHTGGLCGGPVSPVGWRRGVRRKKLGQCST